MAVSTSSASAYIAKSSTTRDQHENEQRSTYNDGGGDIPRPKWTERELYLGCNYMTLERPRYVPQVKSIRTSAKPPQSTRTVSESEALHKFSTHSLPSTLVTAIKRTQSERSNISAAPVEEQKRVRINRFGSGIEENCNHGLCFQESNDGKTRKLPTNSKCLAGNVSYKGDTLHKLKNVGAQICTEVSEKCSSVSRHCRQFGLCTEAHFLNGMGTTEIYPVEVQLLQLKKVVSEVNIRNTYRTDPEFCLPFPKYDLTITVSCEALHLYPKESHNIFFSSDCTGENCGEKFRKIMHPVLFWTTDYNYNPSPAKFIYRKVRRYLKNNLANFGHYVSSTRCMTEHKKGKGK